MFNIRRDKWRTVYKSKFLILYSKILEMTAAACKSIAHFSIDAEVTMDWLASDVLWGIVVTEWRSVLQPYVNKKNLEWLIDCYIVSCFMSRLKISFPYWGRQLYHRSTVALDLCSSPISMAFEKDLYYAIPAMTPNLALPDWFLYTPSTINQGYIRIYCNLKS